jgi:hypothetical protein
MDKPIEKWNIGRRPLAKEKLHYITSPNPTLNVFFWQGLLGTRQGFGYRAFWI